MTTHIIKLAVGIRDVAHLDSVQQDRSAARGVSGTRRAYTRHKPVRPDVLEDGSLYWVVQGTIRCRQRILGFEEEADGEGRKYCLFVLDTELVPVVPTQRGPFQGWRYLKPDEAPADLVRGHDGELPPDEMLKELRSLGLI
ncbi:MAG TPA: DUF1489 domain-containing protein [Alphaproteobacteria bacterium]|jgi:hypothetical protein|nr:DUF1489 domain-containing protein [Alphaproteobacteria bacterium]